MKGRRGRLRSIARVSMALVLAVSLSLVMAVPAAAAVITVPGDHATIQLAIDASTVGDIINVAAGTYSVTAVINVDVENLTISGAGAATTIVEGSGKNASILDGGDVLFNVTADGVTIENLTIDLGDDTTDFDVGIFTPNNGGIVNLTVQNNILLYAAGGLNPGEQLIHLGGGSGVTITGNEFDIASGNSAIYVGDGANDSLTVSNNTAAPVAAAAGGADDTDGGGNFFNQFGPVTNSTISGNTITDTGIAVYLGSGATPTDYVTVTGNIFDSTSGSGSYGALVITSEVNGVAIRNITVTNNTFTGTAAGGAITIFDTNDPGTPDVDGATITINYNNFAGDNAVGGVVVGAGVSGTVDAEYNWWGGVAGPQHSTNPYNTEAGVQGNDTVSNDVDFLPWMIHDTLVTGWNIWSTPLAPATGAAGEPDTNTIAEALDFWTADSSKVTDAYYFDSATQLWAVATTLTPLQPVYLKLSAAATIDVAVSDSNYAPPGRTMHLGWNLVGPAALEVMKVDDALLAAFFGTGETGLLGYQYAISPSIGQTSWTYIRDVAWAAPQNFVPTEGYWVYMLNQGILNGFTYTPILAP